MLKSKFKVTFEHCILFAFLKRPLLLIKTRFEEKNDPKKSIVPCKAPISVPYKGDKVVPYSDPLKHV